MEAERWRKIKKIVEDALERAPLERARFLEKVCANDTLLYREVEQFLEYENAEDSLLDADVFQSFSRSAVSENQIGQKIGNYLIIEQLGAGGMGAVFLAKRDDKVFEQTVALKIIRPELMSELIRRRFYNERQILANLEHPNIARLLDGGTTSDDAPYLVMEYVEGATISDYAAAHRLTLDERIIVFLKICAAVAFAHRSLVIHRDLKPSNILVTKNGEPKLLDFGIAKLLRQTDASETATLNFAFTPEYASPEQTRGENLTTATDIYSLGVILYELVTGTRPHRVKSKNIGEIIKAVCETDPERPSSVVSQQLSAVGNRFSSSKKATLTNRHSDTGKNALETDPQFSKSNPKSLRGDLDNIILKALRKEPARRYLSVEQFAEDLERYRNGVPVAASGDAFSYRAAKFIRRHRLTVGFAVLVFLSLTAGIAATAWQGVRAERERARAERRFETLRKISNSFVNEVHDAMRDLPGSLPARQLLVNRAAEQLDALAAESDGNKDLQLELVWAYQNLGALPDRRVSERQEIYEKAAALSEQVLAAHPNDYDVRNRSAMIYLDLVYVARLRDDPAATLRYTEKAVELTESAVELAPNEAKKLDDLWTVYYHYALTMQQLGRFTEAIAAARKILPAAEYLYRENPPDTGKYNYMRVHLLRALIGNALSSLGDEHAALAELAAALDECRREVDKNPNEDILRRNEVNISLNIAKVYMKAGDFLAASQYAENAVSIREKMLAANSGNYDYQTALADAETVFGNVLARQRRSNDAISRFRHALKLYESVLTFDAERKQTAKAATHARRCLDETLIAAQFNNSQ